LEKATAVKKNTITAKVCYLSATPTNQMRSHEIGNESTMIGRTVLLGSLLTFACASVSKAQVTRGVEKLPDTKIYAFSNC
jgi:hypothetical protein